MDIESKLEMIHQLRRTQDHNDRQMDSRARILYGKNYRREYQRSSSEQQEAYLENYYDRKNYGDHTTDEFMVSDSFSTFKFRLLLAVLLFVLYFYMDLKHVSLGNFDSSFVVQKISQNLSMEDISMDKFFVEEFSSGINED